MTPEERKAQLRRRQLAARLKAAQGQSESRSPVGNFVADHINTPRNREVAGDLARSGASGLTEGAVGLGDMMSLPGRGMDWLLEKGATALMGDAAPEWTQRPAQHNRENAPPARQLAESVPVVDRALGYQPQTTAGEYTKTTAEFVPGAALLGGGGVLGNTLRYGVAPGLASEAAGQATEGTKAEPYARIVAALSAGTLAGRPTGRAKPVIPRANPDHAKMAETLMRKGVRPTVGQTTGNSILRKMEDSADMLSSQSDDFTRAAMRTTGSGAARATPEAMKAASDDIVRAMDEAVSGVLFTPSTQMAQQADDIVRDYLRSTAKGNIVPDVKNVAREIAEAATDPSSPKISLSTLKDWRSRLGKLMRSSDPATREGAWGLRSVIDDATEAQLRAAGRGDDVAKLGAAREQYRNWVAVSDAATRAGAEAGAISPTQLNQSVIRSQGRRNFSVGNTTDLGNLSRAGAGVLRSEPTVRSGGVRTISPELGGGAAGALVGSQLTPNNPAIGGIVGALTGAGAINTGQSVMRSGPVQSTMMDPLGKIMRALLATGPGALSARD